MEPKCDPDGLPDPLGAAMAPIGAPDHQNGAKMESRTPKMEPKWIPRAPFSLIFEVLGTCLGGFWDEFWNVWAWPRQWPWPWPWP